MTTPEEVSQAPLPGSVVVYQHSQDDQDRFRIGVVVGPVVPDPMTGDLSVGVRLARQGEAGAAVDFIEVAAIVDASPPEDGLTR